ncbi:MAG: DUF1849 family protein [Rhodospirillales bacterium]|jgi:hypothetical protein|nr:DUF1849 family protein [Rhodospirillales bacterium]
MRNRLAVNFRAAVFVKSALLISSVACAIFMIPVASASAVSELVPHRAFYTVSLAQNSDPGIVSDVDGLMTVSMEKTCDAWIYTQDLKTVITPAEGQTIQQSALFTSWESLNGLEYQFASKSQSNGISEELRGKAVLNTDGSGGNAQYTKPSQIDVALPPQTMFPVSHTIWLLDEARSGSRYASRIIFTGTEEYQPELVNAFIGDTVKSKEHGAGVAGELGNRDGWPLSMAFYPIDSQTGIPSFEMNVLQLENGITSSMIMNFGAFAAEITAKKFEILSAPSCL